MKTAKRNMATAAALIGISLCTAHDAAHAGSRPPSLEANVTFMAHFDSGIKPDFSKNGKAIVVKDARLVDGGKWGKALHLKKGSYIAVPASQVVQSQAGTVMFWIMPQWAPGDAVSHTLLSMRWQDGKSGYVALSSGWWEPAGARRLYFVLNNQMPGGHCSAGDAAALLQPNVWHHVVVSWESYGTRLMRIYIDGEPVAAQDVKDTAGYGPDGLLYIGTDAPTPEAKGRSAPSLFDELVIYNRALSPGEVRERYLAQEKDIDAVIARKSEWLKDAFVHPQRAGMGDPTERWLLDEDIAWTRSKAEIDRRLDRLKSAGFTTYVPCVWHGGGSRWRSRLAPRERATESFLGESRFDPVAYVIESARRKGIKVVAWFTVALRSSGKGIPGGFLSKYYDSGTPAECYNIHDPAFSQYISDLVLEVALNYDLDGIFLDYVRSGGICTSELCAQSYKNQTGRNLADDLLLYNSSAEGKSVDAWSRIASWNELATRGIIRRISDPIREKKPGMTISVYGTNQAGSRLEGRNPIEWANLGLIDSIGHGDYNPKLDFKEIDAEIDRLKKPGALFVILANYDRDADGRIRPRSADLLARLVSYAGRRWPGPRIAVYFYPYLSAEQLTALAEGPFSARNANKNRQTK